MNTVRRTFVVRELGQACPASKLEFRSAEAVEVADLTTRAIISIKVAEVSIYRHILHFQGKCFNILNVFDCFC